MEEFQAFSDMRAVFKVHLADTFSGKACAYIRHRHWNKIQFMVRTGLSDDMFSKITNGKMLRAEKRIAVSLCVALHLERYARRALIIAPLSVLGVWEAEFFKFAAFPYALKILTGSLAQKVQSLKSLCGTELQVAVVNYESTAERCMCERV